MMYSFSDLCAACLFGVMLLAWVVWVAKRASLFPGGPLSAEKCAQCGAEIPKGSAYTWDGRVTYICAGCSRANALR